ncbi:class E sortase [Leifsonia sp. LS-T14]|uniref:class E sortase n=1 Tax=unclassified Leifsonia TaxID=2663824 RepID=UPI0035A71DC8
MSLPTPARKRRSPRRPVRPLAVFGEVLVTFGLIVLLFLGWQTGLNNLVVASQQTGAAAQQSQQLSDQAARKARDTAADSGGQVPVLAEPADYQPFAVIYVPRLGADWKRTIRQTVDTQKVLNSYDAGVGHYKGTQMPGQVGNFAIAGHDSGWGNTFIDLSKLRLGDNIYVQTADGWYTYTFRNFQYVQPSQVDVIQAVPMAPGVVPEERIMTITTCNPPFHAGERLIAYNTFSGFRTATPTEIASHITANGA